MSFATRSDDGMFYICSHFAKRVNWRLTEGQGARTKARRTIVNQQGTGTRKPIRPDIRHRLSGPEKSEWGYLITCAQAVTATLKERVRKQLQSMVYPRTNAAPDRRGCADIGNWAG